MKLLVILTGGTIGSGLLQGFIALDKDIKNQLLSDYSHISIDTIQPYTILSEQLKGDYLNKLITCIRDNLNKSYDGIIVTHGTDTLQYSACALSYAFADAKLPIVLVSSNYVLEDPRANGKDNFKYAVEFIKEKIGGVFVSYKNAGEFTEIHQGHLVLPHEIYNDDVKSINGSLGYFNEDMFIQNKQPERLEITDNVLFSELSPVLWSRIHPGIKLPDTNQYKAIILEGYHSGTLPTLSDEFQAFCKKSEIPIYLVGTKVGAQYESTKEYQELGINPLPQISPIYAYIKLWAELSNDAV